MFAPGVADTDGVLAAAIPPGRTATATAPKSTAARNSFIPGLPFLSLLENRIIDSQCSGRKEIRVSGKTDKLATERRETVQRVTFRARKGFRNTSTGSGSRRTCAGRSRPRPAAAAPAAG